MPALVGIDSIAARDPERIAQIEAWVRAGQCHLAVLNGSVVGYVALTRGFFHRPFIEMLMVSEAVRRQGIGRALIGHCIALVPDGDLWSSTNQSNMPMRLLLPALGFVESGRVDGLDEGDPELIYRLER